MKRWIFIVLIPVSLSAEQTKTVYNPFTQKLDYITALTTSSISPGSGVTVSTTTSGVSITATGGGGGTPGGASGQIQYNNAGSFGGDANSFVTSSSETFEGTNGVRIAGTLDIDSATAITNNGFLSLYQDNINSNVIVGNSNFPATVNIGTGQNNTAIGSNALNSLTTGSSNVAIGINPLFTNNSGYSNIALGQNTLYYNTSGFGNMGIGFNTSSLNVSGYENVAIGTYALELANASQNIGIGTYAGYSLKSGGNIMIGTEAGYVNDGGYGGNTFIGNAIGLYNVTSVYNDTIIGANLAQTNLQTGDEDILIGTGQGYVDTPGASTSHFLNIGNTIFGTGIEVNSSAVGNIGIGNKAPQTLLHMSSGTFTIDGNVSPAITIKGSGAPPDSQALCLLGGQLGHCTSVVGVSGGCTCSVP